MTGAAMSRASALAIAGPPVLATCVILAFSIFEIFGRTPFAIGPVRNVAEAAGMGVPSEVLRLIGSGEDPNQVLDVRGEIISTSVTRVSALEAAVWSRRKELVEILDRRGAIVDAETKQHLACLANDLRASDIVDYLAPGGSVDCANIHALDRVLQRTRTLGEPVR